MTPQDFGIITAVIVTLSYLPYIVTFAKGQTKPHAFSWLAWGVMNIVMFFSMLAANAGAGAWLTAPGMFISTGIGLAALRYGERNITRNDCTAFALSLASIVAWKLTANPFYAIVVMLVADIFAYYPSVRKSWGKPYEENVYTYLMYILACFTGYFALKDYNATTLLGYFGSGGLNAAFVAMVLFRRFVLKQRNVLRYLPQPSL